MGNMQKSKQYISLILALLISAVSVVAEPQAVRLEDDFYSAINSEWLASSTIQPGYTQVSTFTQLTDTSREQTQALFDTVVSKVHEGEGTTLEKQMVAVYNQYLDKEARNEVGIKPIEPYLKALHEVDTIEEFTKLLQDDTMQLWNGLYQLDVAPDMCDSTKQTLVIGSTVLQLGDADYYTQETAFSEHLQTETTAYMEQLFQLAGATEEQACKKAVNSIKLESNLADAMLGTKAVTTHPNIYEAIYNAYKLEDLERVAPELPFGEILKALGYDDDVTIIVEEPKWLQTLNTYYTEEHLELIKDYTEGILLRSMAPYLSDAFVQAKCDYEANLYGIEGTLPEKQEAFQLINTLFAEPIGKLYVDTYFSRQSKKDVEGLVSKIIRAYKKRLKDLDWMSEITKKNAILKLESMQVKIGYPEKWEEYEDLHLAMADDALIDNVIAIELYNQEKNKKALEKPVDRKVFAMSPQTVNACYSPLNNTITFPAAILQPPFYDPEASEAQNMGGIGMVIAHEITHAFDTAGARFDHKGNLKDWWTKEDYVQFEKRANRVRDFYSHIEVLPGQYINGDLTVGENIADIGAMACMLQLLEEDKEPDYKAFFESWASIWRHIASEQKVVQLLNTDSHAPGKQRVNLVLMQFESFYQTYGINEQDHMYLSESERFQVW